MTEDERDELIDLYVDDALPEFLKARVEADPDALREATALQATAHRLQTAPSDRPDDWFAERALNALLREHAAAQDAPPALSTQLTH